MVCFFVMNGGGNVLMYGEEVWGIGWFAMDHGPSTIVYGPVFPKGCQASWGGIGCSRKLVGWTEKDSGVPESTPQKICYRPVTDQRPTANGSQLSIIHYQLFTTPNHRHHNPKTTVELGIVCLWAVSTANKPVKKQSFFTTFAFKMLGKIVQVHRVGAHGKIGMTIGQNAHTVADIDIAAAGLELGIDSAVVYQHRAALG